MRSLEYFDPFEIREEKGYAIGKPATVPGEIEDEDAKALWCDIMRKATDKDGKTCVPTTTVTASASLAKAIAEILDDEEHIARKFGYERPTAQQIYTTAKFSKSKWGRINGGGLPDIERGNVFALAVALRLDTDQTERLLYSAGFALNYDLDLDRAMMYFIKKEIYDMEYIFKVLGQFSNIKNGLDCFVFRPKYKEQKPVK